MRFEYKDTGRYEDVIKDIPADCNFTLTPPPDYDHVWRWIDTEWVELLPINNPDTQYDETSVWDDSLNKWVIDNALLAEKKQRDQDEAWEGIKKRRLQAVTSGVYIDSVNKSFHTDDVSATTYSMIAGMIAVDNYTPVQWKVMDNSWLTLTDSLLKEVQTAMSQKTNTNYAVAEQHKSAMLLAENPLEYDYSDGWV